MRNFLARLSPAQWAALLAGAALAVVYVAVVGPMIAGGWIYLDDYVKCEMVREEGIGAAIEHYWSVYSSAYRPLTPLPVAWLGVGCEVPQIVTIPAALMHLGAGALFGFAVARFTALRLAGLATAVAWWFMPFQGEILGWPTNAAAYVPVALLSAAALAVLMAKGDPVAASTRRWVVFAVLAVLAFAIAEQIAPALIALLVVLALFSAQRWRFLTRIALYVVAPFFAYLLLVSLTSGGSDYSRTDVSAGGALDGVWSNVRNGDFFAAAQTLPGGDHWRSFTEMAWEGQWLTAVAIFAVIAAALGLALVASRRIPAEEGQGGRPWLAPLALAAGSLVALLVSFALNSIESPIWISPRMFYLPGVFVALTIGALVGLAIAAAPARARLATAAVALALVAALATAGVLVLQHEGELYRLNATLEERWLDRIDAELPTQGPIDLVIVGMPWTPIGVRNELVPLGEHVVSTVRVPWALPAAINWNGGRRVRSVSFPEVAEWCALPAAGTVVMHYDGRELVPAPPRAELCGEEPAR